MFLDTIPKFYVKRKKFTFSVTLNHFAALKAMPSSTQTGEWTPSSGGVASNPRERLWLDAPTSTAQLLGTAQSMPKPECSGLNSASQTSECELTWNKAKFLRYSHPRLGWALNPMSVRARERRGIFGHRDTRSRWPGEDRGNLE